MPLLPSRRRRDRGRTLALAGGAVAVAAGAAAGARSGARALVARRTPPEPAPFVPPVPHLTAPGAAAAALEGLLERSRDLSPLAHNGHQSALGTGVAQAYRRARQAYGRVSDGVDEPGLADLHAATSVLWAAATFAEPFSAEEARRLARRSRDLLALLEEHGDLRRVANAARARRSAFGPGTLDAVEQWSDRRREKLEARILDRGGRLFGTKPARVARRITDDDPASGAS